MARWVPREQYLAEKKRREEAQLEDRAAALSGPHKTFTPSPQQSAIFDWIENGSGNAIVEAVAGSGKTTTLIEGMTRMRGSIIMAAYNKMIADEISERVIRKTMQLGRTVNARGATFHSIGLAALKKTMRPRTNSRKMFDIMDECEVPQNMRRFVQQAVSLAKQHAFGVEGFPRMTDDSAWAELVEHYELNEALNDRKRRRYSEDGSDAQTSEALTQALDYSIKCLKASLAAAPQTIDFDDMLWVPLVLGSNFDIYDWVLIDEAQDTNPARREIAARMCGRRTRVIAVGDSRQAIYGFTGADADSMSIIQHEFNAISLPLTVTYRCPKAVVEVAREYVDHITAADDAPDGLVAYMYRDELMELRTDVLNNDAAVLCRNTAPLVQLCYEFLRLDVRCHVEGKEIGEGIIRLIEQFDNVRTLPKLENALEDYRTTQIAELMAKKKEQKAEALDDRVECILFLLRNLPGNATIDDLINKVRSLFEDTDPETGRKIPGLTLSTIHKSKGREWKRVYWAFRDQYQPSKYARQPWQLDQEENLMYVAATRAIEVLTIVEGGDSPDTEDMVRE